MRFNFQAFRDVFRRSSTPEPDAPFTLEAKNAQALMVLDWLQLMCKSVEQHIHSKLGPDVSFTSFSPPGSLEFLMIKSSVKNTRPSQEFPLLVRVTVHTSHIYDPYFSLLIKGPSPGFLSDMETRKTLVAEDIPLERAKDIHPHIIREVFAAMNEEQRAQLDMVLWPWSFADLINPKDQPATPLPPA